MPIPTNIRKLKINPRIIEVLTIAGSSVFFAETALINPAIDFATSGWFKRLPIASDKISDDESSSTSSSCSRSFMLTLLGLAFLGRDVADLVNVRPRIYCAPC